MHEIRIHTDDLRVLPNPPDTHTCPLVTNQARGHPGDALGRKRLGGPVQLPLKAPACLCHPTGTTAEGTATSVGGTMTIASWRASGMAESPWEGVE